MGGGGGGGRHSEYRFPACRKPVLGVYFFIFFFFWGGERKQWDLGTGQYCSTCVLLSFIISRASGSNHRHTPMDRGDG